MGPFYLVILWNALFSPQSLKVPKEECNKFTLLTTILFDNMWRIQNQTTFVCHIHVPKKATEKINKTYFDHIVALSALKSPVATKWLPPPPNWVKINFDVAIPHSSTIVVIYRNEVREDHFARSSLLPPSKPIQCEVQATILTLKLAIHRKLCFVVFEGDSNSMIKALQLCPFPPNLLSPFLHIIRLSLSFLICWDFIFVNINIKFLAHNLAQWVVHCIWDRALTISSLYAWVSFP